MAAKTSSSEIGQNVYPYRVFSESGVPIGADYQSLTAQVGGFGGGPVPSSGAYGPMGGGAPGGSPQSLNTPSFMHAQRIWDILINNPLPSNAIAKPFVPGVTGNDLGTTAQRWDLFARDINASGTVTFSAFSADRVVITTTGGQLTTDADLTFDGTTLVANQRVRIGTTTKTATQGDFAAGLVNAAQFEFDQSATAIFLHNDNTNYLRVRYDSGAGVFDLLPNLADAHLLNSGSKWSTQMGQSTGRAPLYATAERSYEEASNVGSGEDNLKTYSLPANSFSTTIGVGPYIHIMAWGTFAANGNNKTLKVYFGSQVILTVGPTAFNNVSWRVDCYVMSSSAGVSNTQKYTSTFLASDGTRDVESGSASQTETAAITVKLTGEGTSNADIVQDGWVINFSN